VASGWQRVDSGDSLTLSCNLLYNYPINRYLRRLSRLSRFPSLEIDWLKFPVIAYLVVWPKARKSTNELRNAHILIRL